MPSLQYINSKLSDAIYILTTHEGDARRRLAVVLPQLKKLNPDTFPSNLRKEYKWVMDNIQRGRSNLDLGLPDYNLLNIKNATASKIIVKIVYIQGKIQNLLNKDLNV